MASGLVLNERDQRRVYHNYNGNFVLPSAQKNIFLHAHNPKHLELLNTLTEMQALNIESNFDLPQIVVCGLQLLGKSSVSEAITEIPLPRSENTCTRFVTKITLRPYSEEFVKVTIEGDPTRSRTPDSQFPPITDLTDLAYKLREQFNGPTDAILRNQQQTKFPRDILSITICGPDRPILQILDLPGLIFHDPSDKNNIELAEIYIAIAKGEREDEVSIRHDWHVLRNRNADDPKRKTPIEERNAVEEAFFSREPWVCLGLENLGVVTSRSRLSRILLDAASREFPKLAAKTRSQLSDLPAERKGLGEIIGLTEKEKFFFWRQRISRQDRTPTLNGCTYTIPAVSPHFIPSTSA
ncbi:P-loop containing nucleoside triphosphate hydrolase protein [Bisporella sp. PMI_857]|nr:P-loop containing nucleoside triphosphate hydrolase protein [Bisporella sp. PMI_857]